MAQHRTHLATTNMAKRRRINRFLAHTSPSTFRGVLLCVTGEAEADYWPFLKLVKSLNCQSDSRPVQSGPGQQAKPGRCGRLLNCFAKFFCSRLLFDLIKLFNYTWSWQFSGFFSFLFCTCLCRLGFVRFWPQEVARARSTTHTDADNDGVAGTKQACNTRHDDNKVRDLQQLTQLEMSWAEKSTSVTRRARFANELNISAFAGIL